MGCAGGSIQHDYYDNICSIRLIDGAGKIHTFTKDKDDLFYAVNVSFGLLGVISTITYQCIEKYNVLGSQVSMPSSIWQTKGDTTGADPIGEFNLFGKNNDENSLYSLIRNKKYLDKTEYMRMFWWPQPKDNIIILWKGHRERKTIDHTDEEYSKLYNSSNNLFTGTGPWYEFGSNSIEHNFVQTIIAASYNLFSLAPKEKNSYEMPKILSKVMNFIIKAGNPTEKRIFGSVWYDILPMDQSINDTLWPMQFSELWFNLDEADNVIQVLKSYFDSDVNLNHTGLFAWEFYASKESKHWLSPGNAARIHGESKDIKEKKDNEDDVKQMDERSEDVYWLRVDVMVFTMPNIKFYPFFNNVWEYLVCNGIDFRLHWAKWYPRGNQLFPNEAKNKYEKYKNINTWQDYFQMQYGDNWYKFKQLREKMDPNNVFLTKHWKQTFGIVEDHAISMMNDQATEMMIHSKNQGSNSAVTKFMPTTLKQKSAETMQYMGQLMSVSPSAKGGDTNSYDFQE